MEKETQISALISQTTKELLERHVRATGVKKGRLCGLRSLATRESGGR